MSAAGGYARRRRGAITCALALAIALLTSSDHARADVFGPISLVSASAVEGSPHNEQAESAGDSVISGDGRYVAFDGAFAGRHGVFRRDVQSGEVVAVAEGDATLPSISADGRFVSFTTTARLDEQNDSNGAPDVYVRDMNVENDRACPPGWEASEAMAAECAFTLASAVDGHAQGLAYSYGEQRLLEEPAEGSIAAGRTAITADGREVAFETTAVSDLANPERTKEGLIEEAKTPAAEIAVRDLNTKTTTIVSVRYDPATRAPKLNGSGLVEPTPASAEGGFGAVYPSGEQTIAQFSASATDGGASISADGSAVAWMGEQVAEQAAVMPESDQASEPRYTEPLWRRIGEGQTAATRRVTGGSDPLSAACLASGEARTATPPTLADPCAGPFDTLGGFESRPGLWTGETEGEGTQPIDYLPRLSADGTTVAFASTARDIAFGGELSAAQVTNDLYVENMNSGVTRAAGLRRLTELGGGSGGNLSANALIVDYSISADGRQVAFTTRRTEFPLGSPAYISQPASVLGAMELLDADLGDETLTRVTKGFEGGASEVTPGVATSTASPSFSGDGSLLAFSSNSDNLIYGDGNKASDGFVVTRENLGSTPTPDEISSPPPAPSPTPRWRLGVTADSRPDGSVLLEILVPGPGALSVHAHGAVRVAGRGHARGVARHGHRGQTRVRRRSRLATRTVATALRNAAEAGLLALRLSLARPYAALASRRGGLTATITLTFTAAGHPALHETLDVTFARAASKTTHAGAARSSRRHRRVRSGSRHA